MALITPLNLNAGRMSGEVRVKQPARFWEAISRRFAQRPPFPFSTWCRHEQVFQSRRFFHGQAQTLIDQSFSAEIRKMQITKIVNLLILNFRVRKDMEGATFNAAAVGRACCQITKRLSVQLLCPWAKHLILNCLQWGGAVPCIPETSIVE